MDQLLACPLRISTYRRSAFASLLATLAVALLPVSAGAIVTEVSTGAGTMKIGAQPRSTEMLTPGELPAQFGNAEGHPVVHSSANYAIYWDPRYYYHGDWQHLIDTFLKDEGSASGSLGDVFSVDAQYTDKKNERAAYKTAFRGAYTDTAEYPKRENCTDPDTLSLYPDAAAQLDNVACVTDKQARKYLESFITAHSLPTGMGTIFLLLTPPGVTVCADKGGEVTSHCSDTLQSANGFCSYHSAITTNQVEGDGKTILYAVIPWTAGGQGDFHLFDRTSGYECQDGGWNPDGKSGEEQENKAEESPHQQEPNQLGPGERGPDGSFDTGLADLIVNQIAVEQQNAITDPLLNAWQDPKGNEATDECRNFFAATLGGAVTEEEEWTKAGTLYNQAIGSGHYYLNDAFNLAAYKQGFPGIVCLPGVRLEPGFTSPNPVNVSEIVGFDGSESTTTLDAGQRYEVAGSKVTPVQTYPTYEWNFGDGTPIVSSKTRLEAPGEGSKDEPAVFHSYQYGGTYQVTLTVTDVGGDTASVTEPITVDGPPPPTQKTSSSTGSTTTAQTGTTAGAAGSSGAAAIPAPSIYDFVESKSLKKVLRYGLAIRYLVNEQIAGTVEVILDSHTAKRLGLHGRSATGLPKGSARSIVLGNAVLVTTKGGRGTIRVRFAKKIGERLKQIVEPLTQIVESPSENRKLKLKLTLRIVVHNGARPLPQTVTELSTVVLSH